MPSSPPDLTDAQQAAVPGHVAHWVARGRRTDPPDPADVERVLRACHDLSDVAWPGQVVYVDNPVVLALAAPIAACVLDAGGRARDRTPELIRTALADRVRDAVGPGPGRRDWRLFEAVRVPVARAVRPAVPRLVTRADVPAVVDALRDAVTDAVRAACPGVPAHVVDGALAAGLDPASDGPERRVEAWVRGCSSMISGRWQLDRSALRAFQRDVCGVRLPGDLWQRDRALAASAAVAGAWWPHRRFTMVSDRPVRVCTEEFGAGTLRLHAADGPALTWRSGWGLGFWHGVPTPAGFGGWDVARVLAEENTEIRRMAIEHMGWDRFVREAGLTPAGPPVPDPGNPGRLLRLFDVPVRLDDRGVRVLVCENGSRDRDGTRRTFGLTVPVTLGDPIAAAAWTYDVAPAAYAALARRT